MSRFTLKTKHLYLLALFQLVAGPLVLMQVSVFCSLTVREAPQQGVAKAIVKAWENPAFQSLLNAGQVQPDKGSLPSSSDDKAGPAKAKIHLLSWQSPASPSLPPAKLGEWPVHSRTWTSAWPQAPPGTPPRAV